MRRLTTDGAGGRPDRAALAAAHGREVGDLVRDDVRLLLVGINPGLWTAAVGSHFARPGNRFYPALAAAGVLPRVVDAAAGLAPADEALLLDAGIGVTNLVRRATARADELTTTELRAGAVRLARDVAAWRPAVVAVLGVTAYRTAFGRPRAVVGEQTERIGGVQTWVVPNPSGLNAHESVDSLARAYREVAVAAGVVSAGVMPDGATTGGHPAG